MSVTLDQVGGQHYQSGNRFLMNILNLITIVNCCGTILFKDTCHVNDFQFFVNIEVKRTKKDALPEIVLL